MKDMSRSTPRRSSDVSVEKKQVVLVTPESYVPNLAVDKHLLWGAKLRKKHVDHDEVAEVKKSLGINYQGKVSKLSLGMKERVSLATALIASPKVILVDEAFGNIDNRTRVHQRLPGICTQVLDRCNLFHATH